MLNLVWYDMTFTSELFYKFVKPRWTGPHRKIKRLVNSSVKLTKISFHAQLTFLQRSIEARKLQKLFLWPIRIKKIFLLHFPANPRNLFPNLTIGSARIKFSYHLMLRPAFKPRSIELHRPVTFLKDALQTELPRCDSNKKVRTHFLVKLVVSAW